MRCYQTTFSGQVQSLQGQCDRAYALYSAKVTLPQPQPSPQAQPSEAPRSQLVLGEEEEEEEVEECVKERRLPAICPAQARHGVAGGCSVEHPAIAPF